MKSLSKYFVKMNTKEFDKTMARDKFFATHPEAGKYDPLTAEQRRRRIAKENRAKEKERKNKIKETLIARRKLAKESKLSALVADLKRR